MSEHSPLHQKSANLKKALLWTSEMLQADPAKKRLQVLREAELKFDLTPLECEFLEKHLTTI